MSNTIVDAFEFTVCDVGGALAVSDEAAALSHSQTIAVRDCAEMRALAQNLMSALIQTSIAQDLEQQTSIVSWTA